MPYYRITRLPPGTKKEVFIVDADTVAEAVAQVKKGEVFVANQITTEADELAIETVPDGN